MYGPLCGPGSKGSEGSARLWQAGSKGGGIALRAMSIIMPPFGGHVHIEYHNRDYHRPSLRHFVALFP